MALLTMGYQSPKIKKSDESGMGYLSCIMYLAPYKLSGYNTCSAATEGCIKGCLNTSGRGRTNSVQEARIRRTKMFFEERLSFIATLRFEVAKFVRKCNKLGKKPAIRLNGTSDIMWESVLPELIREFPEVQWYDYTKIFKRMVRFCRGEFPKNYHLTFSKSELNLEECQAILQLGGNVAVVFRNKNLPQSYLGSPVHNADETDLRFLDKPGVQGLYAKGKAKRDDSGFVMDV